MFYRFFKPGSDLQNGSPFICQLIPLVGQKNTSISPFVGRKLPFVGILGVTLVELIVTLTIAGILVALAAPPMSRFVSNNRLASQINDLIADINLARSEAIKQNITAGVCKTAVGGTACVAAGTWANGWMVYTRAGAVTTVLRTHERLSGRNTLTSPVDAVEYAKSGAPLSTAISTFTLCDSGAKKTRVLTLSQTGRPTLSEGTC